MLFRSGLSSYRDKLEGSFVLADMKAFRRWPETMEQWERLFTEYPTMVGEVFDALFVVDGKPAKPLCQRLMPPLKQRGLFRLFREMRGALKSL